MNALYFYSPVELYAKIAEKVRKETLQREQAQSDLPIRKTAMKSIPVNKRIYEYLQR
jgi:hypothetical protein